MQKNRLDHMLDSESAWRLFLADVSPVDPHRYVRLNPDLGENVPGLDDVAKMKAVQERAKFDLQSVENDVLVRRTAYRLIASVFSFDKDGRIRSESDASANSHVCSGIYHLYSRNEADVLQASFAVDSRTIRKSCANWESSSAGARRGAFSHSSRSRMSKMAPSKLCVYILLMKALFRQASVPELTV